MAYSFAPRRGCLSIVFAGFVACGSAQAANDGSGLLQSFPAGSITSTERADDALAAVERERAAIHDRYSAEEQACFVKFFASVCVEDAKERRRIALNQLRNVEQEANLFKRKQRVAERDATLRQRETDAVAKGASQAEPTIRSDAASAEPTDERESITSAEPGRRKLQAPKTKHPEPDAAEDAQRRAANVAAYQRKLREVEARQREIEARRQERQRDREAKAAPAQGGSAQ